MSILERLKTAREDMWRTDLAKLNELVDECTAAANDSLGEWERKTNGCLRLQKSLSELENYLNKKLGKPKERS